jgi:hypothetical protein
MTPEASREERIERRLTAILYAAAVEAAKRHICRQAPAAYAAGGGGVRQRAFTALR